MTRGMKDCYIYCTDPGMREYIRNRLNFGTKGCIYNSVKMTKKTKIRKLR